MPQRRTPNANSSDDRVRRSLLRRFGRILGVAKSEASGVSNDGAKSESQASDANSSLPPSGRPAFLVAAGIMLSRIAGLIRDRSLAHFLGSTDAADAFRAALRIPNILQNLFGEGVLSASFIPTYARLLGSDDEAEADQRSWIVTRDRSFQLCDSRDSGYPFVDRSDRSRIQRRKTATNDRIGTNYVSGRGSAGDVCLVSWHPK